jgi:hypothetical protein
VLNGNTEGSPPLNAVTFNVTVCLPEPEAFVYVCGNLAPCGPPFSVLPTIFSTEPPSPQSTENVAVIAVFGIFVVVFCKYISSPVFAVAITLPPLD